MGQQLALPVRAPATLAALPSTRAIETRSLPALARRYLAALPSMSLSPNAPFLHSRRVLCLPRRSIGEGGSLIPSAPFTANRD
jgi:hypothetical protein